MSFVVPSQRIYDEVPGQPEASQIALHPSRIPDHFCYDKYSSPMSAHPAGLPAPYVPDGPRSSTYRIGDTRCYWSLLSSDLQFIYVDPSLARDLAEDPGAVVGKSLVSFFHPNEQASAKHDLWESLKKDSVDGSVISVRFSRLSSARRHVDYHSNSVPWSGVDKMNPDPNYMVVDIVINWAADGLVLCFIHAAAGRSPDDINENRTVASSSSCGTSHVDLEQLQLLYQRLLVCIPQSGTSSKVFQILSNDQEGEPLFTWPPTRGQDSVPCDREFAMLIKAVDACSKASHGAKTRCTSRWRSSQPITRLYGNVDSIFIPHGSVTFACHRFHAAARTATVPASDMQQLGYNADNYVPAASPEYYDSPSDMYGAQSSHSPAATYNTYPPQTAHQLSSQVRYSPTHQWSQAAEPHSSPAHYDHWNAHSPALSSSSLPSVTTLRSSSSSYPSPDDDQNRAWSSQSSSYADQTYNRPQSPNYGYAATNGSDAASNSSDGISNSRRPVSSPTPREIFPGRHSSRPTGILKCSSCKATSSPEWRKGPSGKKELCNACGLRYARSRAKKEGLNPGSRRRAKDKALVSAVKQESFPPSSPADVSYPGLRRGVHDDTSFLSTSASGSGSGGEIYNRSSPYSINSFTPSPSPPSSGVNYGQYSSNGPLNGHANSYPSVDSRSQFDSGVNSVYTLSAPLSGIAVHSPQAAEDSHPLVSRLDHLRHYSDRVSTPGGSTSSLSSSSLSTVPQSSYERERDTQRGLTSVAPLMGVRYPPNRLLVGATRP